VNEKLEKIKKNMLILDMSLDDAPYFGATKDFVNGARFAMNKILEGTGLTLEELAKERGSILKQGEGSNV